MKKWIVVAGLGLAIGMAGLAPAVRAQDMAASKSEPKAAPSPSAAVLEQWNEIGGKLIAIAEDLPEDKYDYKPNPESRSFVAQLLHAAGSMYYFTDPAQGKKPHVEDPKRDDLKTKAQIVAFVKKCVQDGADLIKAKGDKGMDEQIAAGWPTKVRIRDLATGLVEHSGEHYGQLVVYYRINNMVPPESRKK